MGKGQSNEWKRVDIIIAVVAMAMVTYHFVSTQYLFVGLIEHLNIHLGFALVLIFLAAFKRSGRVGKLLFLLLTALSAVSVGYVGFNFKALELRSMFNTPLDLVIGVILVIVVLAANYLVFGAALVGVAVVGIVYICLGQYLRGFFRIMEIEPDQIISHLSIGLSGIYGELTLSANYIFMFMLLGAILQTSGAIGLFIQIGRLIAARVKSGPAMSAVVTSAMVGTITGSVGANIVTTGSFTIPLMKKTGYKPMQAGAIEAAASTGGQIMPPVMGAAAFAMSGVTGIPYSRIMIAAIIPALMYYLAVGLYVQFRANTLNLQKVAEAVDVKEMLLRAPLFILPLGVLVYLLIEGYSLMYCAVWTITLCFILSMLRKQTRASFSDWIKGLTKGAMDGAAVASAVATIGIILRILILTGLAIRLPGAVEALCGGNIIIALLIIMVVQLIMGMGMSTLPEYLIVAMVAAPVLIKMGLGVLAAHFIVFFWAVFAVIVPPVAVAPLIASRLADAPFMPTAIETLKASMGGLVIPFLIFWNPVLLLEPAGGSTFLQIARVWACCVVVVALGAVLVNQYMRTLKIWERALFVICVASIIGFFVTQDSVFLITGSAIFVLLTVEQLLRRQFAKSRLGIVS